MGEPLCGDDGHRTKTGQPCRNRVMFDSRCCWRHAGSDRKTHRAQGVMQTVLDEWGISRLEYVDPGEMMLRLIAQSARRVQRYADLIGAAETAAAANGVSGDPALSALLAPDYVVSRMGERIKVGLKLSALVELESLERDRLAIWCRQAIAAGLEERRVRAAENEGMHLAAVMRAFAARLGLTAGQRELIPSALTQAVADVFGPQMIEGETV